MHPFNPTLWPFIDPYNIVGLASFSLSVSLERTCINSGVPTLFLGVPNL